MSRPLSERVLARLRYHISDPIVFATRRLRNREREFRPVFVVGAMGSGTTLLGMELWRRFEFAGIATESALQIAPSSFLHVTPVATHATVRDYERALEPAASWSVEQGRADLQDLYRSRAEVRAEQVVDKGPNANLVRASFLARCFPQSVFVLIYRDPAANIEGFRRKWEPFGHEPLQESIRFYARIHRRFLEAAESFRERCVVVSYSGLVERNEETLKLLGERLALAPLDAPRRLAGKPDRPGKGIRSIGGGAIRLVRDAEAVGKLSTGHLAEIRRELDPLHGELRRMAINESSP